MNEKELPNIRLLIVEDNEDELHNLRHCNSFPGSAGSRIAPGLLEAEIVTDYKSAAEQLEKGDFNAVISDVFIPYDGEKGDLEQRTKLGEILRPLVDSQPEYFLPVEKWTSGEGQAPFGLYVAQKAKEKNIPVVFCSSERHHGKLAEPVYRWGSDNGVRFTDPENSHLRNPSKNWEKAFGQLIYEKTGFRTDHSSGDLAACVAYGTKDGEYGAKVSDAEVVKFVRNIVDVKKHYGLRT